MAISLAKIWQLKDEVPCVHCFFISSLIKSKLSFDEGNGVATAQYRQAGLGMLPAKLKSFHKFTYHKLA